MMKIDENWWNWWKMMKIHETLVDQDARHQVTKDRNPQEGRNMWDKLSAAPVHYQREFSGCGRGRGHPGGVHCPLSWGDGGDFRGMNIYRVLCTVREVRERQILQSVTHRTVFHKTQSNFPSQLPERESFHPSERISPGVIKQTLN